MTVQFPKRVGSGYPTYLLNRMIRGWDIVMQPFSKWRLSAILNFWKLLFSSRGVCLSMVLLVHAKYRVSRTITRGNISYYFTFYYYLGYVILSMFSRSNQGHYEWLMSSLPHIQNYSAFNSVQMLKISCFYHQVNNSFCFLNLAAALYCYMRWTVISGWLIDASAM